jgi:DNA repair protein SbcC/Rad50
MRWICKVIIENFQSHEKTILDLEKGLNVITGPSDQGKSAIIRAVKWVLYNEPRGIDFIRQGTTTARVTIEMNNGCSIIRERSKSKNRYEVIYPDGTNLIFEGFGNEVPVEIVKAHGIPKIVLDSDISSNINLGEQLEGPFLISETTAVRAKAIGRLIGLHIIDSSIRDCLVDIRRENQTAERIRSELTGIESTLEGYSGLPFIEDTLNKSNIIISKLENMYQRVEILEKIRKSILDIDKEYLEYNLIYNKLKNLKQFETVVKDCESAAKKKNILERLKKDLDEINNNIEFEVLVLAKTKKLEDCIGIYNEIKEKYSRHESLNKLAQGVIGLKDKLSIEKEIIKSTKNVPECLKLIEVVKEKTEKERKFFEISKKYSKNSYEIDTLLSDLKKSIHISDCNDFLKKLNMNNDRLIKLDAIRENYNTNCNSVLEGNNYLYNNKIELEKLIIDYSNLLKEIGKCPLCNSEISDIRLSEILKHYEEVK